MVTASVAHEAYPKGVFSPTPSTAQNSTPVIGWIGISYPFGVLDRITLYSGTLVLQNAAKYKGPKLIIAGTADDFVKGYEEGLLPRLDKAKLQVETVDGMNHFWEGSEQEIISRVEPWLKGVVGLDVRKPAGNGAEARL